LPYIAPIAVHKHNLTKGERILKPKEYQEVRKGGKKHITDAFIIHVLPTDRGISRLGLSVSARVGRAIRRNRIKRLIREFFRLNKACLPPSSDILISARKGIPIRGYKDVEKELGFLSSKR
jgi:ribonuclease P protein component